MTTGNTNLAKAEVQDGEIKTGRVHITMSASQRKLYREFADEMGTSFSQLARLALEEYRWKQEGGGLAKEFQPLLNEIENLSEEIDELSDKVSTFDRATHNTVATPYNYSPAGRGLQSDITDRVRQLFYEQEELDIIEIGERLDVEPSAIKQALRELVDGFVVEKVRDSGLDIPTWRLVAKGRGGME